MRGEWRVNCYVLSREGDEACYEDLDKLETAGDGACFQHGSCPSPFGMLIHLQTESAYEYACKQPHTFRPLPLS
jgi:hypothetical protein